MIYILKKAPWEFSKTESEVYKHSGWKTQQKILDKTMEEKKKWTSTGAWKNWEEGRKKRLKERRDYFRKHQDKKDDFSGV